MRLAASALTLLLLAGTAHAEKLVLYTSQPPEQAQQTVDAFQAEYPEIEVEWTRNGTSQLMNVLRAEIAARRPEARMSCWSPTPSTLASSRPRDTSWPTRKRRSAPTTRTPMTRT